jgi:hypothetical protein
MLKLLLDEHIPAAVAKALRRSKRGIVAWSMNEWQQGRSLGSPDALLLETAALQGLTLVTYDCRTIPSLLQAWTEEGRSHAGVIFIDEKTIVPHNVGALVRALMNLLREAGDWDWTNRVRFLRRD